MNSCATTIGNGLRLWIFRYLENKRTRRSGVKSIEGLTLKPTAFWESTSRSSRAMKNFCEARCRRESFASRGYGTSKGEPHEDTNHTHLSRGWRGRGGLEASRRAIRQDA